MQLRQNIISQFPRLFALRDGQRQFRWGKRIGILPRLQRQKEHSAAQRRTLCGHPRDDTDDAVAPPAAVDEIPHRRVQPPRQRLVKQGNPFTAVLAHGEHASLHAAGVMHRF